jgi:hypothetical protein
LRRVEKEARLLFPHVNFDQVETLAVRTLEGGEKFFESTLAGLKESGVNVRDPLELLLALRNIGAGRLERMFGPGVIRDEFGGKDFGSRIRVCENPWKARKFTERREGSSCVH